LSIEPLVHHFCISHAYLFLLYTMLRGSDTFARISQRALHFVFSLHLLTVCFSFPVCLWFAL
jgi:hypothetical protein